MPRSGLAISLDRSLARPQSDPRVLRERRALLEVHGRPPLETAEPPSYPPADFRRRAVARALDLLIGLAPLVLVPRGQPRAGELLCNLLLLAADSLFGTGRSLGKPAVGLRALALDTRRPAGILACLRRNAVFALAPLPALLGAPHPLAVTLLALAVICAVEAG